MVTRAPRLLVLVGLVACSSKKPSVDDELHATPRPDAMVADGAAPPTGPTGPAGPAGEVQVRVEWKDVPTALRASPGRTPCNTPRPAAIAPTTTWGVPDVFVVVEGAPKPPGQPAESRVTLADCALAPRVAVGSALVVDSTLERPAKLAITRRGELAKLDALADGTPRPIQLPIAGHAVAIALDANGVYQLALGDETAWIVAGPAAITDASGVATLRNVGAGAHAVTAWLPPRSGQPARVARGTITVVANELAELTLDLAK